MGLGQRPFSPSEENTLLLSTGWPETEGLQFTSRMAPQPLGPQTQVFCKEDRNTCSGRSQVHPQLYRYCSTSGQSQAFLQGELFIRVNSRAYRTGQ